MGNEVGDPRLGVWRAVVVEASDPEGGGRVRVKVPAELAEGEVWARVAIWFRPQPEDEVIIAFEGGDLRQPVVIGALWSSSDAPPGSATGESGGSATRGRRRRGAQPPRA